MKELLIINLTRMGDLLQTTPLMAGLKNNCPGCRLTLLVNTAFKEICKGIPFIDELVEFDMQGYRDRLAEGNYTLVENYRFLEKFVHQICEKEYDLTFNLTHSPVSALLTSFVRTKEIRGFTTDPEGHRIIKHHWMRYFFNVIPNRTVNPFHIVDMYLNIGEIRPVTKGLVYTISPSEEEAASALLLREGVSEEDMIIGFHLGASKSDKTWPVSSYAELAGMIEKAWGTKILLFGSSGEMDLARQFEMHAQGRTFNLVGKTSLGALAALLKRCRLFISNDTGPLHIATAVGTKVIDISTGNVHFMETGPYGEGHYVVQTELPCVPCGFDVQCRDMVCKTLIKPSAVFEVARDIVEGRKGEYSPDDGLWSNVQVYTSYFREDSSLGFYPIIRYRLDKAAFYRTLYRQMWKSESGPLNGTADGEYKGICRELSAYDVVDKSHEMFFSIRKELESLLTLAGLAEEGLNGAGELEEKAALGAMNLQKMKEIAELLENIDEKIDGIGHTCPTLRPLTVLFLYEKESLEGNDVAGLAKSSLTMYEGLKGRADYMAELMRQIIPLLQSGAEEKRYELITGRKSLIAKNDCLHEWR